MNPLLERELRAVSHVHPVMITDDHRFAVLQRFMMPPGWSDAYIDILLRLSGRYPIDPPGTGMKVFVPSHIRRAGRRPVDLHLNSGPGFGNWAWWCYSWIDWDPCSDDLFRFLDLFRKDITEARFV